MWTLIHESGFGAWVSLFLTVIGLAAIVTVGRKRGRPGSVAATWAVAVLASGAIGFAAGQRMVDRGINEMIPHGDHKEAPAPERRTAMLSRGTREASANLFLAGFEALGLSAVGGALSLIVRPKEGAPS
jgi:hypothetical protein